MKKFSARLQEQQSYKSLLWLLPLTWFNSFWAAVWSQYEYGLKLLSREQIDQDVRFTPIPVTISLIVLGLLLVPIVISFIKRIKKHKAGRGAFKIWSLGSTLFWFVVAMPSWLLLFFSTHIGGNYWAGLFRPDWITYGWLATTFEIVVVLAAIKVFKMISNAYLAQMKQQRG